MVILEVTFIPAGGPEVGGGHVVRCHSLAAALELRGTSCRWFAPAEARSLFSPGDNVGAWGDFFGPEGLDALSQSIPPGSVVVVDSYLPSPAWFEEAGRRWRLAVVDDLRDIAVEEYAAAVLNPNPGAEELPYRRRARAKLLLGASYALLRPAFWDLDPEEGHDVFAVAGASDPQGVLVQLVRWWRPHWPFLRAVAGPLMPAGAVELLRREVRGRSNAELLWDPGDFPERMARAGRVLCTSSGTSLEALALKKPLAVFQVAENQRRIGEEIARRGWGVNLGLWGAWEAEDLARFLEAPPRVFPGGVDPRGARRAAEALEELLGGVASEGTRRASGAEDR